MCVVSICSLYFHLFFLFSSFSRDSFLSSFLIFHTKLLKKSGKWCVVEEAGLLQVFISNILAYCVCVCVCGFWLIKGKFWHSRWRIYCIVILNVADKFDDKFLKRSNLNEDHWTFLGKFRSLYLVTAWGIPKKNCLNKKRRYFGNINSIIYNLDLATSSSGQISLTPN